MNCDILDRQGMLVNATSEYISSESKLVVEGSFSAMLLGNNG